MTAVPPPTDLAAWLTELEAAHAAATPGPWGYLNEIIATDVRDLGPGSMSYKHLVCYIRDDDRECYDGPADAAADAALIVAAVNALPQLTAAIRGVLALADELEGYTRRRGRPAEGSYDYGVNLAQADAADSIRTTLTAALTPVRTTP